MSAAFAPDLARLTTEPRRLLVFLGGQLTFPPQLLRLIELEIEELELIRLDPQKLSGPEMIPPDCHLVFEDTMAARVIGAQDLPRISMLIHAYRQTALARDLLRQNLQAAEARLAPPPPPLRFLPLHMPLSSFVALLRILLAGDSVVPFELLSTPMPMPAKPLETRAPDPPASADPQIHLTPREAEVLALVACGQRNKLIARKLQLSEHTVKLDIHHIISKIGATNRTEAAQWYQMRRAPMPPAQTQATMEAAMEPQTGPVTRQATKIADFTPNPTPNRAPDGGPHEPA